MMFRFKGYYSLELHSNFYSLLYSLSLLRLFEQYPTVMPLFYFSVENGLDLERTLADERTASHAKTVMDTISAAVSMLHDLGQLVPVLKQLGAQHAKFDLKEEHYDVSFFYYLYHIVRWDPKRPQDMLSTICFMVFLEPSHY